MSEFNLLDEERLTHICCMVRTLYEKLVAKVITDIKELPADCRTSGDDSGLADVWEEYKYQVQGQESFFFEAYELTIGAICLGVVGSLSREQQGLLWLWSDAYLNWDEEDGEIPYGDSLVEALQQELYRRVCKVACDEDLANDPDVERDLERFYDDMRLNFRESND